MKKRYLIPLFLILGLSVVVGCDNKTSTGSSNPSSTQTTSVITTTVTPTTLLKYELKSIVSFLRNMHVLSFML